MIVTLTKDDDAQPGGPHDTPIHCQSTMNMASAFSGSLGSEARLERARVPEACPAHRPKSPRQSAFIRSKLNRGCLPRKY